jgi:epoxyqueuosine reductase
VVTREQIKELARACGFELAGVTPALPTEDFERFEHWCTEGFAGEMHYMTDHRASLRSDPRQLLPTARTIVCVGKLYNTAHANTRSASPESGWISRYAWGQDYHGIMREGLDTLAQRIQNVHGNEVEYRVCVDTAPLLERSYARAAGLGWIGRNTCLINQGQGSWFFLGELLLSIPIAPDSPASERCGTCHRCIDACPTQAIVQDTQGRWMVDSNLCISYLTIEKRRDFPEGTGHSVGNHVFGCDICQDVCPWNFRAMITNDERFAPAAISRDLEDLAQITEAEFRTIFRDSPVWRAKYEGFVRNVAFAMANSGAARMLSPLTALISHPNQVIANAAREATAVLSEKLS